jgi:hypothetical protein
MAAPAPRHCPFTANLGHAAVSIALDLQTAPKQERYMRTLESGAPLGVFEQVPLPDKCVTLRVAHRTVNRPLKKFVPFEEADAEATRDAQELLQLRQANNEAAIRVAGMRAKRSRTLAERSRAYYGKSHTPLEIQAIRINGIVLIGMPGEPFVEIGLAIKAGSPFPHTPFSGYSNVGGSYIPMADVYPVGGYKVNVTPYKPEAAQAVVVETLTLLHDLAALD